MTKFIYSYYDKVQEAYTQPLFQDLAPDQMSQGLCRAIKKGFKVEQLSQFAGMVLYKIGEFDDETGGYFPDKQLLLDCDEILKIRHELEEKKEGDE